MADSINYRYDPLNAGLFNDDPNADNLRTGMLSVNQTFASLYANLLILDTRTMANVPRDPTNSELVAEFDFSEMLEGRYFGGTNPDGDWMIRWLGATSSSPTVYANMGSNIALTTLADAWAARTTLTYQPVNDLTF